MFNIHKNSVFLAEFFLWLDMLELLKYISANREIDNDINITN